MWKLILIAAAVVLTIALSGVAVADEPTPSKVLQVRLGNLAAVGEVAGQVTFELTDQSGETQTATREFRAGAGEPLDELAASFTYQGPFRWRVHIADDDGRQLSLLEGNYPGYPFSLAVPLSSRLRVEDHGESVVFLDFVAFQLQFEAIAVIRDQEGMDRVHATAGLDSDGSGVFDPDEVVNAVARPENRLIRVSVPRLSSTVEAARFFIRLESQDGRELANLEGTWTFEGGESLAFDLDAPQIRDITGFYGRPRPSQTVSTVALPNPWDLKLVSLASSTDGADFSFLLGRELELIWDAVGRSGPPQTAQVMVTLTDEEGNVVEGARVTVDGEENLTDEFGRAVITAAPGSHQAVVESGGFQSETLNLDLAVGEAQSVQVILHRPGPDPLDRTIGFLSDHWPTLAFGLAAMVVLALVVLALVTPSRDPQPAG